MKRIILTALSLTLFVSVWALEGVTTFHGVKVDGTRADVTGALVNNGCKSQDKDLLTCVLDERECFVSVVAENEKVWRIVVTEQAAMDDLSAAVQRFNALMKQYKESGDYTEYEVNDYVTVNDAESSNDVISSGRCYAEFFQSSDPQTYQNRLSFSVKENGGRYYIVRTFDNLRNMPHDADKNVGQ